MKRWLCGLAVALMAAGAQAADSGTYFKFDVGPNYIGKLHQDFVNLPIECPGSKTSITITVASN